MAFNPVVDQEITIFGDLFSVAPHPLIADMPYGQEGRQAIVYCLKSRQGGKSGQQMAFKVFKPRFQSPRLIKLARDLTPLAQIQGLSVCYRTVLTMENSSELLGLYPDLTNAMLMPWILGPTWMDILLDQREFSRQQCLQLALSLANTLAEMEKMGIAHCDLSAANILLPALAGDKVVANITTGLVELVDVEQIYSPQLEQPDALPGGSPGYAHTEADKGLWHPAADRFAGAVLLVEMLAWCSPAVREEAWGESYFDPGEMHRPNSRYLTIKKELEKVWGEAVAQLFSRAWESNSLDSCPRFEEWQTAIDTLDPVSAVRKAKEVPPEAPPAAGTWTGMRIMPDSVPREVKVLMQLGEKLAAQDNISGALEAYSMARELAVGNRVNGTISARIDVLKSLQAQAGSRRHSQALRTPPPSTHRCYIRGANGKGGDILINKDLFIVGRSQSADHIVMAAGVSRIHMEFIKVQDRTAARDLNSTNGTYINGRRIEPYALYFINNGDRIKLADVEYEVVMRQV